MQIFLLLVIACLALAWSYLAFRVFAVRSEYLRSAERMSKREAAHVKQHASASATTTTNLFLLDTEQNKATPARYARDLRPTRLLDVNVQRLGFLHPGKLYQGSFIGGGAASGNYAGAYAKFEEHSEWANINENNRSTNLFGCEGRELVSQ
jgi:hypothetical protein